ncbi:MAG: MFS transporter, partial [Thiobacillus sp.]|nr:MFS transporter [Thiobacillus sp.]
PRGGREPLERLVRRADPRDRPAPLARRVRPPRRPAPPQEARPVTAQRIAKLLAPASVVLVGASDTPGTLGDVVRRPEVVALLVAAILMAAAHGPYYTFFTIYLVDTGYSKSLAGWLWALGVICEVGVFLVMPRVLKRISAETVVLITLATAALRFLLIGWWVDNMPVLLFAQFLHALTFAAYHAAAIGLVHRYFTGRNQARGQALYNSLAFGIGGTVGTLYAGAVWQHYGGAFTFTTAAACAGVAAVVFALKGHPKP